ncbi:MAG: hypothetical protein KC635_25190, partial [Myxococcales bacterium]|nr:hypothetical protein [Myxococcales bacterium]
MLLPKRVLLATLMLVTGGGTASAGLTVPPPTWLPPAATAPRLWFDGGDVAVITALRARVSDPAVAGYYASFKGYVDGLLTTLLSGNTSDDTRSKVAKAAALLHVLGKTPPTGSHGYTSYAQVAFAALGAVRSRQPVNTVEKYFNPPGDAIDVLTDSSRLQSLAEAYDLLASTARTPETDAKVRGIIAQWANAVRQDWNLTGAYFVPGHRDNWGIKAGAALVTTAIALSGHGDADAWLDDGMTYLDESLDAVTSETGWFLESPWYLNYSLANLVPTAWHVKNALGLDWFGPLEPLVDAAFAVRQPDGRAPPFEEGLPNVFPWDVLAAAYPARAATMKWAWAQSPQTVANFDNEQIHTVTRFLVADTTTLPSAPTAPPTSFLGGDTRAAFLRTGWGADAFAISTMTARDTSATAAWSSRHNIQNPLDLILHARSTLLVPTSGGGPLVTRSEDRDEYLSPTSKNLPLIEGTAPFVVDASAVTFGARLDSRDAGARPQHLADLVLTEVSGYPNGGRARRVVALVDNQYAAVFDHLTVSSNQNRSLELSWRGRGQRTQVAASNQRAANRWSYGQARVQIDTTATGNLSTESNASLYADAWGQEESVSGVIVGRSGRALTLVSALQAYPSSASAMSVTTSSTSAAAAMTVSAVGGPDILVSAPGTGPASAAGVTLDGKAAIVRKTGPAAAVVDAVSLSVDGATWLVASPAATLAWTVSGDGFVVTVSPDSGASFSLDLGHTGLDLSEVYAGSVDGVPLGASQLSVDADGFHLKNVAPGTIVVGPAPCRQGSGEDPDGDRICGSADVCPTVADPGQQDSDHDGIGDACECLDAADRCDDGTPCTTDSCVSTSGECKHVPVAVATACDDQSACTSGDHCEAGACVGAPITCNDQNPCTIDGCEPATGCTATPNAGESCDDHDVCTVSDRCDGTGRCVGEVIDCDDDNPCTEDHCGSNGVCTHAAAEAGLACDDGDA